MFSLQSHKFTHSSKKTNYACEICNKTCQNQLKFFEHLKSHYEPIAASMAGGSEKQMVVQTNSMDDAHFDQTEQEMSIEVWFSFRFKRRVCLCGSKEVYLSNCGYY